MARNIDPLNQQTPIVDAQGRPTLQFVKQWGIAFKLTGGLGSNSIIAGSGLAGGGVLADGDVTLTAAASTILDQISSTRGTVLYRGASGWAGLAPGTSGNFLKTNGVGADPSWSAAALDVQDAGVSVVNPATALNFVSGFTVTDAGGGVADIEFAGLTPFDPVTATGTGASQNVTLPVSDLVDKEVGVFVNGIRYEIDEYSIAGATLTLTTNASGDSIEIVDMRRGAGAGAGGSGSETELDYSPPTTATLSIERKTAAAFTASASDVTGKGLLLDLHPTGAGDKVIARLKSAPTAPFTITARFRMTIGANGEAGIMLYNSTNGRNLRILLLHTGQVYSQRWSALETFSSTLTASTSPFLGTMIWLRISVDGSGNVAFYYSMDGAFFRPAGTDTLAAFLEAAGGSLDEVGIYARANESGVYAGTCFHYYAEA